MSPAAGGGQRWLWPLAGLAGALVLNQFVLRHYLGTDLFAAWTPAVVAQADATAFNSARALWLAAVLGWLLALVLLDTPVRDVLDARAPRGIRRYAVAAVIAALAGAGLARTVSAATAGGWAMAYFWPAMNGMWLLSVLMLVLECAAGRARGTRDWLLYSAALALGVPAALAMLPLFPMLLGFNLHEAWITAAASGPTLTLTLAHLLIVEGLDRRGPRPAASEH